MTDFEIYSLIVAGLGAAIGTAGVISAGAARRQANAADAQAAAAREQVDVAKQQVALTLRQIGQARELMEAERRGNASRMGRKRNPEFAQKLRKITGEGMTRRIPRPPDDPMTRRLSGDSYLEDELIQLHDQIYNLLNEIEP